MNSTMSRFTHFRDGWRHQNGWIFGIVPKGGSFPIQKLMLQIFAIINGSLVMNSGKKPQYDFPKIMYNEENEAFCVE